MFRIFYQAEDEEMRAADSTQETNRDTFSDKGKEKTTLNTV
jgi:hypothetical protein